MDINVLAFSEGYQLIFNFIAVFVSGGFFLSLLKLSALIGIIMTTTAFLKGRDPMVFAKWIFVYTVMSGLILTPKTSVTIIDRTKNVQVKVDHVPYVIALTGSVLTGIGLQLAELYESELSKPSTLTYTKTGMLFGSNLLQASHQFKINTPQLKNDMNRFFRNCVVGDMSINHKYTASDVKNSKDVLSLFISNVSPVRYTVIEDGNNEVAVSCKDAVENKEFGLKKRLADEVEKAYTFYGKQLLAKPAKDSSYQAMFEEHLGNASDYFHKMRTESENIVMQNMMINAIDSGLNNYSAKTDSSAGVLNNQFAKSQTQHREAWNIGFKKAIWFLPLMHSVLLLMCFAVFPIILAFCTFPGGMKVFKSYIMFLVSFQLWPVLFSIFNVMVSLYGRHQIGEIGGITGVSIDSLEQAHNDLAGVAGFLMMSIPFLAKGFTSNIGEAFSGLATTLTSHMQSSSMGVAGEVAAASFSLGNNSIHNSTSNMVSANKSDTNWTDMHGQSTVQAPSGALTTTNEEGRVVFNSSPAISNSAVSVASSEGLQDSLSHAKERADASVFAENTALNNSISNATSKVTQFSDAMGKNESLGLGASSSESAQATKALSDAWHIAEDVAHRNNTSTEQAFSHLLKAGVSVGAGADTSKTVLGKFIKKGVGLSLSAHANAGSEWSETNGDRTGTSMDKGISTRDEEAFRKDMSEVISYTSTHHFDKSGSNTENLLHQVGADLREAQTHSDGLSASLSQSERVSDAQNYVETNSNTLNRNLNQEAVDWAIDVYGKDKIGELENNPGNSAMQNQLQTIKKEFLDQKAESIIHKSNLSNVNPTAHYKNTGSQINSSKGMENRDFDNNTKSIEKKSKGLGVDLNEKNKMMRNIKSGQEQNKNEIQFQGGSVKKRAKDNFAKTTV